MEPPVLRSCESRVSAAQLWRMAPTSCSCPWLGLQQFFSFLPIQVYWRGPGGQRRKRVLIQSKRRQRGDKWSLRQQNVLIHKKDKCGCADYLVWTTMESLRCSDRLRKSLMTVHQLARGGPKCPNKPYFSAFLQHCQSSVLLFSLSGL